MEQTFRLEGHISAELVRKHPYFYLPFHAQMEPAGRSYVWGELRGPRGRSERGEVVWAMGNPIWLKATEM